ncbi:hypothetical protein [Candidatus Collinsella stercoripullorum]|uniref:hypothetical protein n=1 Tax=Candidatus Collinsella stercoripullorum TaxID=2838522 RepID=UPI0022E85586|nr:hypothetical protein [Candidatus Collinsella stercoripullorum]
MQASHAGLIRGLSITTVVISLLCILLLGALLAFIGLAGSMMDNLDARSQLTYELVLNPDEIQTLESLGIPADDPAILAEWIIQTLGVVADVLMVAHIIVLVAGIMGIRGARRAEKLGALFVWMIVATIASLVGCNPVLLVLSIIIAILAAGERRVAAVPDEGAHFAQ